MWNLNIGTTLLQATSVMDSVVVESTYTFLILVLVDRYVPLLKTSE